MTNQIEPKIISIVRGLTDYFHPEAVTRNRYAVLDKGYQPYNYAVLVPSSPTPKTLGASRRLVIDWKYKLQLFSKFVSDEATSDIISEVTLAVMLELFRHPTLDGLADMRHSPIVEDGTDVQPVMDANGNGPFFYRKDLNLCYVREYALTGGEYA